MTESPWSSPRIPRQFRLRTLFVLISAVAVCVFAWTVYRGPTPHERYLAGYEFGFVSRVVRPEGGDHVDFVHVSAQRGYDLGTAEAERLCTEQRDIPTDFCQRAQLFMKLVKSSQRIPPELRGRIIRKLRLHSRLMEDYDETDIYDHVPASGVGFWCRSCETTLELDFRDSADPQEDSIVSYHEHGQSAKAAGWLVQKAGYGIFMLCPECRYENQSPIK